MNTYLVRSREDKALVGIFCAESVDALHRKLQEHLPGIPCECLSLGAGDALIFDGQFVQIEVGAGQVETNLAPPNYMPTDEQLKGLALAHSISEESIERLFEAHLGQCETGLEVSESLFDRMQTSGGAWAETEASPIEQIATAPENRLRRSLPFNIPEMLGLQSASLTALPFYSRASAKGVLH